MTATAQLSPNASWANRGMSATIIPNKPSAVLFPTLTGMVRLPTKRSSSISRMLLMASTHIEISPHTAPAKKGVKVEKLKIRRLALQPYCTP